MLSWSWQSKSYVVLCFALFLVLFLVLILAKEGLTAETATPEPLEEVLLAIHLNGQDQHDTPLLLKNPHGGILARAEDFARWRLHQPDSAPLAYQGDTYYQLDTLTGLSYRVDESQQALFIEGRPEVFLSTSLKGTTDDVTEPTPSPVGGFLNYDLLMQHTEGSSQVGVLLEQGVFSQWGVGTSSVLGRDLSTKLGFMRLESTWTWDRPSQLASLRLGDAINQAGSWGRAVRFGGVQWATNFATRPDLITFPLPTMLGESALPSTVDLYVNDALRLRRDVQAGPFTLNELPVVTGQGDIRMVVRDVLGREQIISQPYYAALQLLRPGLHDYSYEAGFIRKNFSVASLDYGRFLAVGTHRLGLSEHFTGEAHGEVLPDQQTVGLGGAYLWPAAGVFTAALAGSHSQRGLGKLFTLGFERQTRNFSFGAHTQLASQQFTQVGIESKRLVARQMSQVFASYAMRTYGSLALSYIQQDNRRQADIRLFNANYSLTLGKLGHLNLSFLYPLSGQVPPALSLTFTRPFGESTSASLSVTAQREQNQARMEVQRNLPSGRGIGYRVGAERGATSRYEAEVSAQNDTGTYTVEAAQFEGQNSFRGTANGGIAVLGGKAFLSRRLEDSFAVVQIPNAPNVGVYAENQLVAHTDSQGNALVPRLRPYDKNQIRIEQADLPLDAQVAGTLGFEAIPAFRSGLLLQVPVKRSHNALLTLVLDDGRPLPAGAMVQIIGDEEQFPVALAGAVFVTGLAASNQLRATWHGQSCEFVVTFPETTDPQPDLGTFRCKGVQP